MNLFWKKIAIYSVMVALAVPLVFFMVKNLEGAKKNFNKEEFLGKLNLSEVQEEMNDIDFEAIKKTTQGLRNQLEATTTSTSTE